MRYTIVSLPRYHIDAIHQLSNTYVIQEYYPIDNTPIITMLVRTVLSDSQILEQIESFDPFAAKEIAIYRK